MRRNNKKHHLAVEQKCGGRDQSEARDRMTHSTVSTPVRQYRILLTVGAKLTRSQGWVDTIEGETRVGDREATQSKINISCLYLYCSADLRRWPSMHIQASSEMMDHFILWVVNDSQDLLADGFRRTSLICVWSQQQQVLIRQSKCHLQQGWQL